MLVDVVIAHCVFALCCVVLVITNTMSIRSETKKKYCLTDTGIVPLLLLLALLGGDSLAAFISVAQCPSPRKGETAVIVMSDVHVDTRCPFPDL